MPKKDNFKHDFCVQTPSLGHITCCQVCFSKNLATFLSLGHQPPSDAFLRGADLVKSEITYPLSLYFCPKCSLVQLGYVVDPKLLFQDYVYNSGTNNSLKVNFKNLVDKLIVRFKLKTDDLAIDVGSNDGTLLENYRAHGVRILGIDPSSVAVLAIKKGIPTIIDFFNERVAASVNKKYGKAKVITATNVFAHVVELGSFMMGITKLLASDGVFISESHYLLDIIKCLQYDSIYHEHLRYYSLRSLIFLFKKHGLEVIDVERISTHNGSLRVYAARPGSYMVSQRVFKLLNLEERNGLYDLKLLRIFAKRVEEHRHFLQNLILKLNQKSKSIVGIGAPAKGNTLLNACRLGLDMIDYLVEKSDLKIGMFAPGTHIPVVSEKKLFDEQPDYALVLSWNIADELITKLRTLGYRGKFIIPLPKPQIISK